MRSSLDDPRDFEVPSPLGEEDGKHSFEVEDALLGHHQNGHAYNGKRTSILEKISTPFTSTKLGRKFSTAFLPATAKPSRTRTVFFVFAVSILFGILISLTLRPTIHRTLLLPKNPFCKPPPASILSSTEPAFTKKPKDVKVYGLVFYGRRRTVSVLDCYLRKNLVKNGGWFDEVHFLINTQDEDDLAWIHDVLPQVPEYKGIQLKEGTATWDFESVWRQGLSAASREDAIYVKLDDDLLYLSPSAIPEVVSSLLRHPEAFTVLANLINCAALGWLHHHNNAILSYLPELNSPSDSDTHPDAYGPSAWRASALPTFRVASTKKPFFDSDKDWEAGPPYPNHRWLPLRDNGTHLPLTPMWKTEYHPNSFDWNHWQLGAQQHYSFLSHLEALETDPLALSVYHFGDVRTSLFNTRFAHMNINLMAVWASDILDNFPFSVAEDDEAHFTITLPQELKKQVYVQTRAIAAHHSFGPQGEMYQTDVLGRYRAYANEHVCRDFGVKLTAFEGEGNVYGADDDKEEEEKDKEDEEEDEGKKGDKDEEEEKEKEGGDSTSSSTAPASTETATEESMAAPSSSASLASMETATEESTTAAPSSDSLTSIETAMDESSAATPSSASLTSTATATEESTAASTSER